MASHFQQCENGGGGGNNHAIWSPAQVAPCPPPVRCLPPPCGDPCAHRGGTIFANHDRAGARCSEQMNGKIVFSPAVIPGSQGGTTFSNKSLGRYRRGARSYLAPARWGVHIYETEFLGGRYAAKKAFFQRVSPRVPHRALRGVHNSEKKKPQAPGGVPGGLGCRYVRKRNNSKGLDRYKWRHNGSLHILVDFIWAHFETSQSCESRDAVNRKLDLSQKENTPRARLQKLVLVVCYSLRKGLFMLIFPSFVLSEADIGFLKTSSWPIPS